MKIPRFLTRNELAKLVYSIAETAQVTLKQVITYFDDESEVAGKAFPKRSTISINLLSRMKKYDLRDYLPIIVHEIAHLWQSQYKRKWNSHTNLPEIIEHIARSCFGTKIAKNLRAREEMICYRTAREETMLGVAIIGLCILIVASIILSCV